MKKRTCCTCGKTKLADKFSWRNKAKNIKSPRCKECHNKYMKEYYANNKDKFVMVPEEKAEYNRAYRKNNKEYFKRKKKEWYDKNCESARVYARNYALEHKEEMKAKRSTAEHKNGVNRRRKLRYKTCPMIALRNRVSVVIRRTIKMGKSAKPTFKLLGYTKEQLWMHLVNTIPIGFTVADFLSGKLHIDHIIPQVLYNNKGELLNKCWNMRNLRLVQAIKNDVKGNKLNMRLVKLYKIGDLLPDGVI